MSEGDPDISGLSLPRLQKQHGRNGLSEYELDVLHGCGINPAMLGALDIAAVIRFLVLHPERLENLQANVGITQMYTVFGFLQRLLMQDDADDGTNNNENAEDDYLDAEEDKEADDEDNKVIDEIECFLGHAEVAGDEDAEQDHKTPISAHLLQFLMEIVKELKEKDNKKSSRRNKKGTVLQMSEARRDDIYAISEISVATNSSQKNLVISFAISPGYLGIKLDPENKPREEKFFLPDFTPGMMKLGGIMCGSMQRLE